MNLGGNIADLVMGATKNTTKGTDKPPPTSVELENEFMSRYKKQTGQDLYPQYRDVVIDDKGTKQRALAYMVDGKPYAPIVHGIDFPFQKSELIAQIPSLSSVRMGHFKSGSQGVDATVETTPPDGITGTYKGGAVGGSGNAPMDLLLNIINGGTNPTVNAPEDVDPADSLRDPSDPLAPQYAPVDVGDPTSAPNVNMMPGLLGVTPQSPANGPVDPQIQGNGNPGTGTPAPVDIASVSPASWIVKDKDGNIDPEKSQEERIKMELARRGIAVNPNSLRKANAADKRSVVDPKVGGEGLLALLGTTLLAGNQGTDIVKGAVGGIQDSTARRQARSDIDWQSRQNEREASARGIDADNKEQESQFARDMQLLTGLRSADQREAAAAQKAINESIKQDQAQQKIEQGNRRIELQQNRLDVNSQDGFYSKLRTMTPEQRGLYYDERQAELGLPSIPEDKAKIMALSEQELMLGAKRAWGKAKAEQDALMAPIKMRMEEAKIKGEFADTALANVRMLGEKLDNNLKEINIKYLPDKLKADIALTGKRTKSLLDAADRLTQMKDSGGITMNNYVNSMLKNGNAKLEAESAFKKYESLEKSLADSESAIIAQLSKLDAGKDGDAQRGELTPELGKIRMAKANASAQKEAAKISMDGYAKQYTEIEKMKPGMEKQKKEGREWLSKNKNHPQYTAAYDLFIKEFGENP